MRLVKRFKLVPKKLLEYYTVTTMTPHEAVVFANTLIHAVIHMKILQIFILVLVLL